MRRMGFTMSDTEPMGNFTKLAQDLGPEGKMARMEQDEEAGECEMCHKGNMGKMVNVDMGDHGKMRMCAGCAAMLGEDEGGIEDMA